MKLFQCIRIFCLSFLTCYIVLQTSYANDSIRLKPKQNLNLLLNESRFNDAQEVLRYSSSHLHQAKYYNAVSGDLFEQFVQFLFPLTGREKRTMFLPLSSWGPKKPQYKRFKWQKYESNHFVFYYDVSAYDSFKKAHAFLEDDFNRNNEIFSVRNKFLKKIPIIIYQSRKDFEQTNIVSGPVPEGLGGVTEIFSWKRAVFPFEGEMSSFEHVTKHEGTHIYQIAKGAKNLPLWFIEGSAETNSIYWDADAEQFIRDAYFNDLFYSIDDLWQIQGSWLMYKIGNYICNFIRETYGERALQKIYKNSVTLNFKENIKQSLGISLNDLDKQVQASLSIKYGYLYKIKNPYENVLKIQKKSVVMHAYKSFFISGQASGSRNALYINYIDPFEKITQKKIITDRKVKSESLNYFRKGAWLNDSSLIYAIKNGSHDEIRLHQYSFDQKNKKFKISKPKMIQLDKIRSIFSPVLIDKQNIAFIGVENGYTNIYIYDIEKKSLKQITKDNAHYANLDYSSAKNTLIFSKEMNRDPKRIYYNRDLFEFKIKNNELLRLTDTDDIREDYPKYSISGTNILFSSDEDQTHNLYLFNSITKTRQKLSNHPSGIKTGAWADNDSLLLNINSRFVTDIGHVPLPSAQQMLKNELSFDQSKIIPVKIKKQDFIYEGGKDLGNKNQKNNIYVWDDGSFYEKNNVYYIFYKNKDYKINKIAPLNEQLFIEASNIDDEKERIVSREESVFYFKVNKGKIQSVYNPVILKDNSDSALNEELKNILSGKLVISTWYFKEENLALVQVNEKLTNSNHTIKNEMSKKTLSNLYTCDLNKKTCNLLEGSNLNKFKKEIFWAAKLENGSYIWTLSENKNGPYELFLYNSKLKKSIKISNEALRFKVSKNKRSFSIQDGSAFILYYFSENKGWVAKKFQPKGNVLGYDFTGSNQDFMVVTENKKSLSKYLLSFEKTKLQKINHTIKNIAYVTINKNNSDFVVYAKKQDDSTAYEKLYHWDSAEKTFYDISIRGKQKIFSQAYYLDDFLVFYGKNFFYEDNEAWVWKDQERASLKNIIDIKINQNKIVVNLENSLYLFDFQNEKFSKIANNTYGYDLNESFVYYASTNNEKFNLYRYDFKSKKNTIYLSSSSHLFNPVFYENKILYQSFENKQIKVKESLASNLDNENLYQLKKHHVFLSSKEMNNKGSGMRFNLLPIDSFAYKGPLLKAPNRFPLENESERARDIYKLQSLVAAAAYDGSSFRILLNAYVDNIFSDRGVFANVILLGETKFAVLGISDLRNATSYSIFFNERENIQNYGINFSKKLNIDRYRAFNFLTELEKQIYSDITPAVENYVDADIANRSFYVLKGAVMYGHDVTLWDRHGPVSGNRVFFKLGTGLDLTEQRLAFYSANMDARYYNSILNKFSFAHRLSAGTSQGKLPEVYLAGGNLSFRGASFDELDGQNYAIFSEDVRLPLFNFIGAQFFDPLDRFIGFLTRFFDVRTGMFIDVGDVWYNNETFDLMYSSGAFANVPTLLGVNLRFHYAFWGEQGFGFWIGSNW